MNHKQELLRGLWVPRDSKTLNCGIYFKIILGIPLQFKVSSLIQGFWSLWVNGPCQARLRDER